MKRLKRHFFLSLLVFFCLLIPLQAEGELTVEIKSESIESSFARYITAYLEAESDSEIVEVEFFYRPITTRTPTTKRNLAEFEPGKSIEASYRIDAQSTYFPPGAELEYWWRLTDAEENSFKTEVNTFVNLDNRYDFDSLSNERVTLYWYRGGDQFGERLFQRANDALVHLEEDFGVALERPVQAFIYNGGAELRRALGPGSNEWTGGVAYSEYGVIAMGVAPNNLDWGLGATTHELAHLVIHQVTDNPYGDIPRWLDEGLAVYSENPEQLDFQFQSRLDAAIDSNDVMTFQTLSSSFPADSQAANLAYAQSASMIFFLMEEYGGDKIGELLNIFSEGALYDDALEQVFGVDTWELDAMWRDYMGLPPLQLENNAIQTEPEVAEPESKPDLVEPTSPPQEGAESVSPSTSEANTKGRGLAIPCFNSVLPVVFLGLIVLRNRRRKTFFKN